MKKVAITLIIAVLIFGLVSSIAFAIEPEEEWRQTFGGSSYDHAESIQQASDGGYIITGYTDSYGNGNPDVWMIKTDSLGNKLWDKTFGGSEWDRGYSVKQTSDGGYIIAGDTRSYGAGNFDVWLIKTDSEGNPEWVDSDTGQIGRTFGGSAPDYGRSVQQTPDGGYIITGYTASSGAGGSDVWLIKTDSAGNQEWSRTFGDSKDDHGYSVQQASDGGYIIVGDRQAYWTDADNYDVWLIKTDSDGNGEWTRTFGGSHPDYGRTVQLTSDGGYIITGSTASYGAGNYDAWLIKTDSSGIKAWDKTFGGSEYDRGYSVQQASDGGYIITGYTESSGAGSWDMWLVKTGPSGNKVWDKAFGGLLHEWGSSVQQVDDGGYIIAGSTQSYGSGSFDVWLVKVEPEALAIPSLDSVSPGSGNQGGNLSVTVTGANLTWVNAVSFGEGITVSDFTVNSDTQITAEITIAFDATLGTRDVLVTTPDGSDALTGTDGFTVTAPSFPTVSGISPSSGDQGEKLDVTITGTNLTGSTAVSFDEGITVSDFTVDSDTQITAGITIASDATPGTRDVSVDTPDGSDTLTGGFAVTAPSPPTVTGISPDSGDQGKTIDITITGTNLTGANDISDVSLGTGITVNSFTVDSDIQITASVTIASDATQGPRDVSVTTPDGSDTLTGVFTVTTPSFPAVTGISPDSGDQGETPNIIITGTNLTGAYAVSFGEGISVSDFNADSDTQITADITIASDATPGTRDVTVTTLDGSDTLASGFTVMASPLPSVTGVSPDSGDQGETLDIMITGAKLTGATAVNLGTGITVNSFVVDSDTKITAGITIASGAIPGTRDVSVTTPDGSDTLASGFTVTAPSSPKVTGVNPDSGDQGEKLDITITGANLTGATAVSLGTGITVNSFVVDSDTQITANIGIDAKAITKVRNVSVTTPDGVDTLEDCFIINQDDSESSFKLFFKLTSFWIYFIAASQAAIILASIAYFTAGKKSH